MMNGIVTVEEQRTMRAIQNIDRKLPQVELRDLFAMTALVMLNGTTFGKACAESCDYEPLAEDCYKLADAMLAARKEKKNGKAD